MTPQEAVKLWCPMVRWVELTEPHVPIEDAGRSALSNMPNSKSDRCIASECACWKYTDTGHTKGRCGLVSRD